MPKVPGGSTSASPHYAGHTVVIGSCGIGQRDPLPAFDVPRGSSAAEQFSTVCGATQGKPPLQATSASAPQTTHSGGRQRSRSTTRSARSCARDVIACTSVEVRLWIVHPVLHQVFVSEHCARRESAAARGVFVGTSRSVLTEWWLPVRRSTLMPGA